MQRMANSPIGLQRPGSVALALPRLAQPDLQTAEALAALDMPASRDALAYLLGTTEGKALAARLTDAPLAIPDPDPFNGGATYGTATEEIIAGYATGLSHTDVRQLAHAICATPNACSRCP